MNDIDFSKVPMGQLVEFREALRRERGKRAIDLPPDKLADLSAEDLAALIGEVEAELTDRETAIEAPPTPRIDTSAWKMTVTPSATSKSTFDIEISDGKRRYQFLSCGDGASGDPLEWAVEQVNAMDERSAAINDLNSDVQGDPDPGAVLAKEEG